eukprot:COSAG02_NODE_2062_length_9971_cov_5.016106_4_plen_122_part_00
MPVGAASGELRVELTSDYSIPADGFTAIYQCVSLDNMLDDHGDAEALLTAVQLDTSEDASLHGWVICAPGTWRSVTRSEEFNALPLLGCIICRLVSLLAPHWLEQIVLHGTRLSGTLPDLQ